MTWLPALAIVAAAGRGGRAAGAAAGRRSGAAGPTTPPWWRSRCCSGCAPTTPSTARAPTPPTTRRPLVLLAGILHQRIGERWPQARAAVTAALAVAAAGLVLYPLAGLYSDNNTEVRTARGSFVANDASAPALQRTLDLIERPDRARRADPRPALRRRHLLHGRPAAGDLRGDVPARPARLAAPTSAARSRAWRQSGVRLTVLSSRDFSAFGFPQLRRRLRPACWASGSARDSRRIASFGDVDEPVSGSYPSAAFTIYERR